MYKEWNYNRIDYFDKAYKFNSGKNTVKKMTNGSNPIEVGNAFLQEKEELQTGLPNFPRRFFIVITAKVVANLGLGRIIWEGFGIEDEPSNNEVEYLIDSGFDGDMAESLVYTALHWRNKIEGNTQEIDGNGISDHLRLAREKLGSSKASEEIKSFPEFILETLEGDGR